MAVDISKVFKANVKAIRISLADSGVVNKTDIINDELFGKSSKTNKEHNNKNPIQQETKKVSTYVSKEAKIIIQNITILKNFLQENKKSYVQPNYLLNQQNDNIDWQAYEDQAESIIKKCVNAIRTLKENTLNQNVSSQFKHHLENMFYLLEKYLKDVCNIYSEQKAIRVKRVLERKNLSQLCSNELKQNKYERLSSSPSGNKTNFVNNNYDLIEEEVKANEKNKIENEFTEQEIQEFKNENELLYDDLTSQSQEIKQIESEVIEVSRLTQIFAEKIVSQLSTAEIIHKTAMETNSNLTIGNENIKEAMKKNAALRLWILFIIVVLSFTLLFLDWYND